MADVFGSFVCLNFTSGVQALFQSILSDIEIYRQPERNVHFNFRNLIPRDRCEKNVKPET